MSLGEHVRAQLCNHAGRAGLLRDGRVIDVEKRSNGVFSADPMDAITRFREFCAWAQTVRHEGHEDADVALDPAKLGPCVPRPAQVFAIGLNYRDHAKEAGLQVPAQPMVFTKFASCLTGARGEVALTSHTVDFEVELVVVIAKRAHRIDAAHALEHVAGYCVGQDISDRGLQFASVPPQFSLGKSAPGFGPLGPALVDGEGLDPSTFKLTTDLNGTRMQDGKTSDMIFPVPEVIAYLSHHCALGPGDLIFTGTPAGVGSVRNPRQYLKPGDVIRSEIPGLGVLENRCT